MKNFIICLFLSLATVLCFGQHVISEAVLDETGEPVIGANQEASGSRYMLAIGPSYDLYNQFYGVDFDQEISNVFKSSRGLTTNVSMRFGNLKRLVFISSNEFTKLLPVENFTYLNLRIDYDHIKTRYFDYDIIEGIDLRRIAVTPRFSGQGFKFGLGYLNQEDIRGLPINYSGITADLELTRIKSFDINIYGRVEFIEFGPQYIFSLKKHFAKIRTSLSIDFRQLRKYRSFSVSALYRFSNY